VDTLPAVAATSLHPASDGERERLVDDFVRFCEIESPSGRERAMADAVAAELRDLGLDVEEDDTAAETGSDSGNVLARIPRPEGARPILLCAHLDTVPLDAPVEVSRENGVLTNRHEAILGADNKAAVATLIGAARRLVRDGPPVGVELLFTTSEERALRGAKAFDRGRLQSEFGFVFDHASPIGEVVVASPTYYRLEARFRGQAAHAGIRPEKGRNAIAAAARAIAAMRIGRLDGETTANVGRIEGGTSANVVAERCTVELEARSLDDARAGEVVSGMVDAAAEAASNADCDVETSVERMFRGYRLPRTARAVEVAAAGLRATGIEPTYIATGGGSDANAFIAAGLPVVNVANGTERNHQPDESVTVEALETMLDVTLAIVAASTDT
jgi:tripeptide aminopeptidase